MTRTGRPRTGRKNVTTTIRINDIAALRAAFGMPVATTLRVLAEELAREPTPERAATVVGALLMASRISR